MHLGIHFFSRQFFKWAPHLSVGISANGYPVSDNRTLNCEEVVLSHIKGGETSMGTLFALTRCPLFNVK